MSVNVSGGETSEALGRVVEPGPRSQRREKVRSSVDERAIRFSLSCHLGASVVMWRWRSVEGSL